MIELTEKTNPRQLTGNLGQHVREWQLWYSGDPTALANYYSGFIADNTPNGRFWAALNKSERDDVVHMPLAGDIAQTSANLLFSEPPELHESNDRIDRFLEVNGLENQLLESAELAAAFGGVYLKLDTDPAIADIPLLSTRTPERVRAIFRSRHLREVLFWRIVHRDNQKVHRLFEHRQHRNSTLQIIYRYFEGTPDRLGKETAVPPELQLEDVQYENFQGLGVVYIPNMLPNRFYPALSEGQADYAQCIPLLDSLDQTWTSWMRDIELGQGRIFVDRELLNENEPIEPGLTTTNRQQFDPRFDPHQRAYVKMDMTGWKLENSKAKPIETSQFKIRVDEHRQTMIDLVDQIVSRSGYAPQTFGLKIEGRAESGTALRIRERKSELTQRKKAKYWRPQLRKLLQEMQQLDMASHLSSGYDLSDAQLIPAKVIVHDVHETAETIRALRQAEALSIQTSVAMAHPDWDAKAVQKEVQRIQEESGSLELQGMAGA